MSWIGVAGYWGGGGPPFPPFPLCTNIASGLRQREIWETDLVIDDIKSIKFLLVIADVLKFKKGALAANDSRLQKSARKPVFKKVTAPDQDFKASLMRQKKKSPGSFTASHKKHRVYIGVNLRLPAPESAIIHYKPRLARKMSSTGPDLASPVVCSSVYNVKWLHL